MANLIVVCGPQAVGKNLKIDNTNLLPDEVADKIIEAYGLVADEKEEKEYRFGV